MAAVFTWRVSSLKCAPDQNGLQNVVGEIDWHRLAQDGDNVAEAYGTLNPEGLQTGNFVNYADLTQDIVISWIEELFGQERIQKMDEALQRQLDFQANPPQIAVQLPWEK